MSPNYTNTELLTKYLDKELDDDQFEKLELRLKEDANLKEEFDNLKVSLQAIKSLGLYEKVGSIHAEMMKEFNEQPVKKIGSSKGFIKNTLRIAATVIILLGSVLMYQYITLSSNSLFKNNFREYTLHVNRGNNSQSPVEQEYKLSHYAEAIELFQGSQSKTLQDYFIAGNAYLELNNPSEA